MAVIAGIDEAGFGPVLGPLVVSVASFEAPDRCADMSMWEMLAAAVSRRLAKRHAKVPIADSKKLYSRKRTKPLQHLERAVLAMLAIAGRKPTSLTRLLRIVAPEAVKLLGCYPWYAGADVALPHSISEVEVELAANSLAAAMGKAHVRLLAMRCQVIPAGEFNRIVRATRNKSTTLFDTTMRLVAYLWRRQGGRRMRIHIDRHGTRRSYLRGLQRAFEGCDFKVIDENDRLSAYRMTSAARSAEIDFTVRGEDKHLPVALASMLSKYMRELMMLMLNRFWAARVPGLVPTAGYYTDGRRFFGEIQKATGQLGIDKDLLYRCR